MDVFSAPEQSNDMNELLLGFEPVKLRDRILLSPYTKLLMPALVIGMISPFVVYAIIAFAVVSSVTFSTVTCNIRPEFYVDCLPGRESTEVSCMAIGCCWNATIELCFHSVPAQHGYTPSGGLYYEGVSLEPRRANSPLGSPNADKIYLDVTRIDSDHLQIALTRTNPNFRRKRSQSSSSVFHEETHRSRTHDDTEEDELTRRLLNFLPRDRRRRTVEIQLDGESRLTAYAHYPEFSVTVARGDFTTDETTSIFSTALGPLLMTETYWEWTMYVNNATLYGLTDLELNGTTGWVYNSENGTITPAFLGITDDGLGAAYYVEYDGPLEVQVLNTTNLVILRGMAIPESLSVHIFAGPTPIEAVQQLVASMSTATMPAQSDYGLQICPNGEIASMEDIYADLNATTEILATISVPWDSHCIHERFASTLNRNFTSDELALAEAAQVYLSERGRRFVPHLSPMLRTDDGALYTALLDANLLLLSNESIPYVGVYHDENVVYPEWENDVSRALASSYLDVYVNETTFSPLSIWVRDAWPKDASNSSSGVDFSTFDYMPEELRILMNTSTIPYDLTLSTGSSHHATRNAYAKSFRLFVRSSITTVEFSGPTAEAANLTWSGLRRAVRSAVGSGLMGQLPPPMYICATGEYNLTLHDQLCVRWYQAAVAMPHVVVLPDRMPGGTSLSTSATLAAAWSLSLRAALATYQHATVANYFLNGTPVLAPTYLYFPDDRSTSHTWDQFMWGKALMVGLVTLPMVSQIDMRLPGEDAWRHLMGGVEATLNNTGTTPVTAATSQIITLVRPGYLIPIHKDVGETTMETMQSNVSLAVNLACSNAECHASGEMYYGSETGAFLSINVNATTLQLENVTNAQEFACVQSPSQSTFIETVELLGNVTYRVNVEVCDIGTEIYTIELSDIVE